MSSAVTGAMNSTANSVVLTRRGVALQEQQRHGEAIQLFLQSLALKVDDAFTHYRMGVSFRGSGMKLEAAECFRTALALGFDEPLFARGLLAYMEREGCRWPQAAAEWQQLEAALQAAPADAALQVNPFVHAVLGEDPLAIRRVAAHYARFLQRLVKPLPAAPARRPGRLRIAYLSADFYQHATAQLVAQVFECHDRSRFEVTLLSAGPDDRSAMRTRLRRGCERFEDVRSLGHEQIARRIRALGIDILVDLKGATDGTLLPVLACRPAPLQLNWLAYPGTSGADYIDYIVGDRVVTPLEHEAHFSEKIAQLPRCYQPNDALRPRPQPSRRSDWGAPVGVPLLAAFHQSYKISAEVFGRWCEILRRTPDAVLWLLEWNANVKAALLAAAREHGIAEQRLCFAPLLPLEQHLSRLACADLFLDTWPCNAHTTAGEALWVGVPVLSVIGVTFAQRVGASLLQQAGLGDLVCASPDEYVARAAALAGDTAQRERLHERVDAARESCGLFDGAAYARDLETLYERMWARHQAGLVPEHLAAPG